MATAVLDLFKNCKIVPEKNAYVEEIDSYLLQIPQDDKLFINNFQYQKIALNMTVKVDMGQANQHDGEDYNWNYCRIIEDTKWYYFFIVGKRWVSEHCISLDLAMDTLNTYRVDEDYEFTDKTKIIREHKDRFVLSGKEVYESVGSVQNNVWYIMKDERVNTPHPQVDYEYNDGHGIRTTEQMWVQLKDSDNEIVWDSRRDLVIPIGEYIKKIIFSVDYQKVSIQLTDNSIPYQIAYNNGLKLFVRFYNFQSTTDMTLGRIIGHIRNVGEYKRIVDKGIEGINPVLYGEDKDILDNDGRKWYLIYKSNGAFVESDPKAVNVYLAPDVSIEEEYAYNSSVRINPTDLAEDDTWYYVVMPNYNGIFHKHYFNSFPLDIPSPQPAEIPFTIEKTQDGNTIYLDYSFLSTKAGDSKYFSTSCLAIKRVGSTLTYKLTQLDRIGYSKLGSYIEGDSANYIEIKVQRIDLYKTDSTTYLDPVLADVSSSHYDSTVPINSSDIPLQVNISPFSAIDRTDPTLIKCIELPYKPTSEANLLNAEAYDEDKYLYILNRQVMSFTNELEFTTEYNPFNILRVTLNPSVNDLRNDDNESKLFNSEYYQPRVVYDSFSYTFYPEYYISNNDNYETFKVDMCTSNSSVTKFGFRFPQYLTDNKFDNYQVMTITRNNEVPIFNSQYLNYLRTGINADIKSKNTQIVNQAVTAGVSLVGAFFDSGISAVLSANSVRSLISLVTSNVQAENSIAEKLNQAKNSQASINGSDDIGLLNWYADGNKLKLMVWKCSDMIRKNLADLFYYCGYTCNYRGKPDIESRYWFNYVQCEPVITNDAITDDRKNDLINKWKEGVTVYHYHSGWDFEQQFENWEVSVIE